jgi:hypothetical protein
MKLDDNHDDDLKLCEDNTTVTSLNTSTELTPESKGMSWGTTEEILGAPKRERFRSFLGELSSD